MNTKTILSISMIAAFAVSLMMSQSVVAEDIDFTDIVETEVTKTKNAIEVTIVTGGTIPEDGTSGAFGYGMITGTNDDGLPENVLALTTHKCVSDSFNQGDSPDSECPPPVVGLLEALGLGSNEANDGPLFHAHILDLKLVDEDSACFGTPNGLGLEVDLTRTLQTQNNVSPSYAVNVVDDAINVSGVSIGDVHSANFKNAVFVYFGISGVADGDVITNLCLTS